MSRSGYSDDCDDQWQQIMWRGAVARSIGGARGQAFLREMADALDAMPNKRLAAHTLAQGGEVCAIGSVGVARGLPMEPLDPEDADMIAAAFRIAPAMVREIEWSNDEAGSHDETPEQRWHRMRNWVAARIKK